MVEKSKANNRILIYVYSPPWRANSAGIKVLHFLVHSLNQIGNDAWLVLSNPTVRNEPITNPKLNTPILTQEKADNHFAERRNPWVVYSETVPGNPLGASKVVRYLLNFPGTLGGPSQFEDGEVIVSYSKTISDSYKNSDSTLFIPIVDLEELPDEISAENKKGSLIYAGKYRKFIGNPDISKIEDPVEIFRDGPRKQSREQVLQMLNEAKVIYVYENSTIATEALLLGTVCIFVPNRFLNLNISKFELGEDGIGYFGDIDSIEQAWVNVGKYKFAYNHAVEAFWSSIQDFESLLKSRESEQNILNRILVPKSAIFISRHRVRLLRSYVSNQGILAAAKLLKNYVISRFNTSKV